VKQNATIGLFKRIVKANKKPVPIIIGTGLTIAFKEIIS
jgi:hypothetical protein